MSVSVPPQRRSCFDCCRPAPASAPPSPLPIARELFLHNQVASTFLPHAHAKDRMHRRLVDLQGRLVEDEADNWHKQSEKEKQIIIQAAVATFSAETCGDLRRIWRLDQPTAKLVIDQALYLVQVDFSPRALMEEGLTRRQVAVVSEMVFRIAANLSAMTKLHARMSNILNLWVRFDAIGAAGKREAFKASLKSQDRMGRLKEECALLQGLSGDQYVQIFEATSVLMLPQAIFKRVFDGAEKYKPMGDPLVPLKSASALSVIYAEGRLAPEQASGKLVVTPRMAVGQKTKEEQRANRRIIEQWEKDLLGNIREAISYLYRNEGDVDQETSVVYGLVMRVCVVAPEQMKKLGSSLRGELVTNVNTFVLWVIKALRENNRLAVQNYIDDTAQCFQTSGIDPIHTHKWVDIAAALAKVPLRNYLNQGQNLYIQDTNLVDREVKRLVTHKGALQNLFQGIRQQPLTYWQDNRSNPSSILKSELILHPKSEVHLSKKLNDTHFERILRAGSLHELDSDIIGLLLQVAEDAITPPQQPTAHTTNPVKKPVAQDWAAFYIEQSSHSSPSPPARPLASSNVHGAGAVADL